jgi:hypothetical protein
LTIGSGVRFAVFLVSAFLLALLQHGLLAAWWWMPDLLLALAAWAMVDGPEEGVLPRVVAAGCIADAADPGSRCFHLVAWVLLAAALLPLRDFLFRSRALAWALWALVAAALLGLLDCLVSGPGDALPWRLWLAAGSTALACWGLGWLLGGLPDPWRPIARG